MRVLHLVLAAALVFGAGCSDSSSTPPAGDSGGGGGGGDSGGGGGGDTGGGGTVGDTGTDPDGLSGMTIPDPGSSPAEWENTTYEGHETPDKAYKVGVVTKNNPYVTMDMHPSGRAYLVFKSGPSLTHIDIDMGGHTNTIEALYLHMHDGDGLKFGSVVKQVSGGTSKGGWDIKPNHVYVFEIVTAKAGFI